MKKLIDGIVAIIAILACLVLLFSFIWGVVIVMAHFGSYKEGSELLVENFNRYCCAESSGEVKITIVGRFISYRSAEYDYIVKLEDCLCVLHETELNKLVSEYKAKHKDRLEREAKEKRKAKILEKFKSEYN